MTSLMMEGAAPTLGAGGAVIQHPPHFKSLVKTGAGVRVNVEHLPHNFNLFFWGLSGGGGGAGGWHQCSLEVAIYYPTYADVLNLC